MDAGITQTTSTEPMQYVNDVPGFNGIDILGPARRVHIDDHPETSYKLMKMFLTPQQYETLATRPFVTVNTWHPLTRVGKDPLAVLDARTLRPEDRVKDVIFGGKDHGEDEILENWAIKRPDQAAGGVGSHRWYYAKDMDETEALMFKMIDTRVEPDGFVGTAHSAFVLPGQEQVEEDRESIEVRAFCFF